MNLEPFGAPNFSLTEFVPETTWKKYGSGALRFFPNPKLFSLNQFYKDFFSDYYNEEIVVKINDWQWEGRYNLRGYRPPWCGLNRYLDDYLAGEDVTGLIEKFPQPQREMLTTGSLVSTHKSGIATDKEFIRKRTREEIDPDEIREIIIENEKKFMRRGLTTLESGHYAPGWVHSDMRYTGMDSILIVGDPI